MKIFGSGGKKERRFRLVARAPGDTTPLDPVIVDAVRKMGMDPAKFTAAPYEEGETDAAFAAFGAPGTHLEHTFGFPSLNSAFSAMEKLLDETVAARIRKETNSWLVSFDAPADPALGDAVAHQRFADVAMALGAQDRGFSRMNVTVNTTFVKRNSAAE